MRSYKLTDLRLVFHLLQKLDDLILIDHKTPVLPKKNISMFFITEVHRQYVGGLLVCHSML